jgi:hypothetical protein
LLEPTVLGGQGAGAACRQRFLLSADASDEDLGGVAGGLLGLTIVLEPSLASSWVDAGGFPPKCCYLAGNYVGDLFCGDWSDGPPLPLPLHPDSLNGGGGVVWVWLVPLKRHK